MTTFRGVDNSKYRSCLKTEYN